MTNADRRAAASKAAPIPGGAPTAAIEGSQTKRPVRMKELRLPPAMERERQQQQRRPPPLNQAARVEVVRPTAALAGDVRLRDSAALKPASAGGSISVSSEGRGNTLVASVGNSSAAGKAAAASSQGGNGVPLRGTAKRAQTPAN